MKSSLFLFALIGAPALAATSAQAQSASDAAVVARIARVETGLLPPARIANATSELWSLGARMKFYRVPGVSVAVIDGGMLEWARGYGDARAGDPAPITTETLFQAASISKPVSAAAALALVDAGKLMLDTDVNEKLIAWKIPESKAAAGEPVTLRRLLSHTAGLTVHGFAGYALGAPQPTLLQVLDGTGPANSAAIRIDAKPGTQWRYSGGGYVVLQQLLIDTTGENFSALLRERVLAPVGMTASGFEQPLPAALAARAAAGHDHNGARIPGDAHLYPELAAAGLWTTPSDLARFALALQHSLQGRGGLLTRGTAEAMLTPPMPDSGYGLGIGVKGDGESLQLAHNGANAGFTCAFVAYPRMGRGAVVMTNSDNGGPLIDEILRALAHEYGWPGYRVVEKTAVPLSLEAFRDFVGRYEREGVVLQFFRDQGRFFMKPVGQPRVEIFPLSDHEFFTLEEPDVFSFERSARGDVTHLIRRTAAPQLFRRLP